MFLKALSKENGEIFLQLAFLVAAVSNEKRDKTVAVECSIEDIIIKNISEMEGEMFKGFQKEFDVEVDFDADNSFDVEIKDCIESVVKQKMESSDFKKEIMLSLAEDGIDLLHLNQDVIFNLVAARPDVMLESMTKYAFKFIDSHKGSGDLLNQKIKRIVVFELLGMAYADGSFDEIERKLIVSIANHFAIEKEILHELEDYVVKLNKVSSEVLELINE